MHRHTLRIRGALLVSAFVISAAPAHADATVFAGAMSAGSTRPMVGFAYGYCPSVIGFEVEVAHTPGSAPNRLVVAGGNINVVVQSRDRGRGLQVYGIGGLGLYGEESVQGSSGETSARSIGGGAKMPLYGPVKLRLDYRTFLVGDAPDASPGFVLHKYRQRVSAGLTVAF